MRGLSVVVRPPHNMRRPWRYDRRCPLRKQRVRIGMDAKVLTARASGIGRYATNLIRALVPLLAAGARPCDLVLFTGPQTSRALLHTLPGKYQEQHCTTQSSLLRALLSIPRGITRHQVDVFHGLDHVGIPLFAKRCRYVLTVHDVIPLLFPQFFTRKHRLVVRAGLARVAQQADMVIVPSLAVQDDVQQHLRLAPERVTVIPEGCEARFQPRTDPAQLQRVRHTYALPAEYVLFVGTLEPRKNITTLLHAFARVHHESVALSQLHLVLAGAPGWHAQELRRTVHDLGLTHVVHFPGFIDDDDLPALYHGALCFVFPSLYEGFGLPLLEAMRCGVPVITANTSAMPEVVGQAAVLIDPRDVDGLAAAIATVADDSALRAALRQQGLVQAQRFSWEDAAKRTLDAYWAVGR